MPKNLHTDLSVIADCVPLIGALGKETIFQPICIVQAMSLVTFPFAHAQVQNPSFTPKEVQKMDELNNNNSNVVLHSHQKDPSQGELPKTCKELPLDGIFPP